jgi:glycosyltransferase involved in cell wall biosynthesis
VPILSIITINLNDSNGLKATLESIKKQTFFDYEQIIIDGGSVDDSVNQIKQFCSNSDKEIKWVSEKDNGIYHAMNKGIKIAAGKYCIFMNAGDILANNYVLETVFKTKLNAEIIFGNLLITINGKLKDKIKGKEKLTFFDLYKSNVIKHQSSFIQRELFDKFGFYNESLKVVSDWEFFLKTIGLGNVSYQYLDLDIALFDNNGLSNNSGLTTISERKNVLDRYVNPLMLDDYKYLESFEFIKPALRFKICVLAIRVISKCAKVISNFKGK